MVSCSCFGSRPPRKLQDSSSSKSRRNKSPSPARPATPISDLDSASEQGEKTKAQIFGYRALATATKNFRTESMIGQGGFGTVYKGRLDTGQKIAVKMFDDPTGKQGDREFLVEVLMLSRLNHENLVHLYGYCAEGDQRGLVYEYMPLGSLDDHIYDRPNGREPLDWNTRIQIALGAAKGLEYLHEKTEPHVIFRDLKASNILLGHGYKTKLSDFGLAKFGPDEDRSHVSTRRMGTEGYCAPEYGITGHLTFKTDIYSFGVVLLELITGRKARVPSSATEDGKSTFLAIWANQLYANGEIKKIADPILLATKDGFSESIARKAVELALMCVNTNPKHRPAMSEVVRALTYIAEYPSRKQKKKRSMRSGSDHEAGPSSSSPKETTRMLEITEEEAEEEEIDALERERAVTDAFDWASKCQEIGRQSPDDQPPKPSP